MTSKNKPNLARRTKRGIPDAQLGSFSPEKDELVRVARSGGITLVIGAGVSISRGVPDWCSLARSMWFQTFKEHALEGSKEISAQLLPIMFELVYRKLGKKNFIDALQHNLYAEVYYPHDDDQFAQSSESLAVIARLIVQEYDRGPTGRIDSVITLNADNLIEQGIYTVAGRTRWKRMLSQPIFRSIARGTHDYSSIVPRPIPIFHIHGYLPPAHHRIARQVDHTFVFTDAQYWSTSASALAFANRLVAYTLSEGRCIFIGLSMTDINLLRWLALRTLEKDHDCSEATTGAEWMQTVSGLRKAFVRHFWIRPAQDDSSGLLTEFLKERGIKSVEISGWSGTCFRELIDECFPSKHHK